MSWGKRMGSSLMSPLKSTLKHELDIDNTQWASLISMVWVVGTVSPFIAGLLLDIMGAPLAGVVAIALILLGNGVCAIAVAAKKFSVFLAGRAIYSLGGGAVFLVGEVILLKWFKGRQLPIAFGCLSTIGGIMSFSGPATVSAVLSRNTNITVPFWMATGLSALGLVCFAVYGIIHHSHFARDIEQTDGNANSSVTDIETEFDSEHSFTSKQRTSEHSLNAYSDSESIEHAKQDVKSLHDSGLLSTAPDSGLNVKASNSKTQHSGHDTPIGATTRAAEKCKRLLLGVATLPESYWYVLLCIAIQGTLFIPLHEIIPEMMETEWGYTRAQSSKLFVYLHIIPIVMHIALGILINRLGHRLNVFLGGSMLVFLASVFITFVRKVPVLVSLIMMNLSGTMVPAAIFSMTNLVIDNGEIAGAALGLIRSAEFASVTLMEMLDGLLQDADHNRYDTVLIGLVVFAGLLLFVAIVSVVVDYMANGGRLNSADPYKPPKSITEPRLHGAETSATDRTAVETSKNESNDVLAMVSYERYTKVPTRRYIYLGIIGVLFGTAWCLYIALLVRM
ncbi:hypothetical protein H4R20_000456 [Coemansia guatemalensis]|uniref:Lysosomal dipeptide transporter MFSD1 n=1 Tax=Coemansia guatemalensis TaxID=2761395 RepID=A0A9W8I1F9_9FUNG|nr:hypothetical protein H4R20_000456 [Coemansia guatemalensis]